MQTRLTALDWRAIKTKRDSELEWARAIEKTHTEYIHFWLLYRITLAFGRAWILLLLLFAFTSCLLSFRIRFSSDANMKIYKRNARKISTRKIMYDLQRRQWRRRIRFIRAAAHKQQSLTLTHRRTTEIRSTHKENTQKKTRCDERWESKRHTTHSYRDTSEKPYRQRSFERMLFIINKYSINCVQKHSTVS